MLMTSAFAFDPIDPRLLDLQRRITRGAYVVDNRAVAAAMLARDDLHLVPGRCPKPATGGAQSPAAGR